MGLFSDQILAISHLKLHNIVLAAIPEWVMDSVWILKQVALMTLENIYLFGTIWEIDSHLKKLKCNIFIFIE